MMGAQRRPVLCAMSLAVAAWALACGRWGPPIRAVSASGASETFDRALDTRRGRSKEAVPYMLQGLEPKSAFDREGEPVFESEGVFEPEEAEATEETSEPAIERSDEPSAAPSGRGSATP